MKIVIFEGPDAAGKDAVRREFEWDNDYKHICVTRMFFSDIVYADYFNRPLYTDVKQYNSFAKNVRAFMTQHDVIVVYATADKKIIYKRIKERGEKVAKQPDLKRVEALFNLYMAQFIPEGRLCRIDTTDKKVEDMAKEVERFIANLDLRRPVNGKQ